MRVKNKKFSIIKLYCNAVTTYNYECSTMIEELLFGNKVYCNIIRTKLPINNMKTNITFLAFNENSFRKLINEWVLCNLIF